MIFFSNYSNNTYFLIVNNLDYIPKGITNSSQIQLTKVTNWDKGSHKSYSNKILVN
jgi:hypothetical protein